MYYLETLYSCHQLPTDSFNKNRSFARYPYTTINIRYISKFTPLFKRLFGIRFYPCISNYLPSLILGFITIRNSVGDVFYPL